MWRALLLSLFFLCFSPYAWSQESSSSKITQDCCEILKKVDELQKQLSNLQATHDLTLKAGLAQQLQHKLKLIELRVSLRSRIHTLYFESRAMSRSSTQLDIGPS